MLQQILRVDRSVEAEEADVACRVDLTDQLGRASAETQSRVHRHRDPDEPSAPDALSVKLLHRDIQPGRRVPRLLEERDRLGEADRLVAELVTRDQQNRARLPQRLSLVRRRSRDLVDAQLHRVHRSFSFSLPSRTAFFATIPHRPVEWEPLAADLAQRLFRHHEGATRIGVQGIGRRELLARWGGLAFGGGDNPPVLVLAADVA